MEKMTTDEFVGLKKVAHWLAENICDPWQTVQQTEGMIKYCEYNDIIPTCDEQPGMYYHGFWEPTKWDRVDKNGTVVGPFAIIGYHEKFVPFVENIIMESMWNRPVKKKKVDVKKFSSSRVEKAMVQMGE